MSEQQVPASDSDLDYGDDAAPTTAAIDAAFERLDQLARASVAADEDVDRAEAALKAAKERARQITEQQIPELMLKMRQTECTTLSGFKVKIKQDIRASLPSAKDKPEQFLAALRWLHDTDNQALIKNEITVALDRGGDERATELVIKLTADGFDANAKKWVEPQTLSKLVRELLEAGKPVPRDTISVYDQKVATVKRAK